MENEKTNAQMRKGVLEYCILLILKQRKSYVPDLIDLLKQSKMVVVEGTLYPLLMRLKNSGYLGYEWQESTSGPPRKYYFITPEGESFLLELDASWRELEETIHQLKTLNN
ncbi:MAG TPA: PadR family transcriptional regulator [Bacteroidales bacterium]|nr:PadR family transcriptional regulator [Bacteroidales bacterium]HOE04326.1 PadR family transcriptional regulator [Bacteroidales bacterium]HQL70466.1 PadR family transcriptional regulator [Bacteroidales bacterium]